MTNHTISAGMIHWTLQGARARGCDVDAILRRAGLPAAQLLGNGRYPRLRYSALLRTLTRTMRDEFWGLCSRPIAPGTFASACRSMILAADLREAIVVGLAEYRRHIPDFAPRLHVRDDVAQIRLHSRAEGSNDLGKVAQAVLTFHAIQLIWWLVGERIPLHEVRFSHARNSNSRETGRLLRADCHYQQPQAGFSFDARWLRTPIVQSTESLLGFLQQAPDTLLQRGRERGGLPERVWRYLRKHIAGDPPSLADIARAMNTTEATLYRHLHQHGLRFQEMKDKLRRELSIEYLTSSEMPLADVAERVGFSEVATFCRAFKKWTGIAPGAYRQQSSALSPLG